MSVLHKTTCLVYFYHIEPSLSDKFAIQIGQIIITVSLSRANKPHSSRRLGLSSLLDLNTLSFYFIQDIMYLEIINIHHKITNMSFEFN